MQVIEHADGPLAGLRITLDESGSMGQFYGWVVAGPRGLTPVLYSPTGRPGVWRFDHFLDQRGDTGKPVAVA